MALLRDIEARGRGLSVKRVRAEVGHDLDQVNISTRVRGHLRERESGPRGIDQPSTDRHHCVLRIGKRPLEQMMVLDGQNELRDSGRGRGGKAICRDNCRETRHDLSRRRIRLFTIGIAEQQKNEAMLGLRVQADFNSVDDIKVRFEDMHMCILCHVYRCTRHCAPCRRTA
jgi:hypothetical protein